eukprot:653606-Pelagomonas_calceolata.AAC.2
MTFLATLVLNVLCGDMLKSMCLANFRVGDLLVEHCDQRRGKWGMMPIVDKSVEWSAIQLKSCLLWEPNVGSIWNLWGPQVSLSNIYSTDTMDFRATSNASTKRELRAAGIDHACEALACQPGHKQSSNADTWMTYLARNSHCFYTLVLIGQRSLMAGGDDDDEDEEGEEGEEEDSEEGEVKDIDELISFASKMTSF